MVPIGKSVAGLLRNTFLPEGWRQDAIPVHVPRLQINIMLLLLIEGLKLLLVQFLDIAVVAEEASELAA